MKILVVALLKPSQVKYKIVPLTKSEQVDEVIIVRRKIGPIIDKVDYIVLPGICDLTLFYLLLTPLIIAYQARKRKVDIILSYHFVPHGFFAWLASRLTGIPFIYSQIDLDVQNLTKNKFYKAVILHVLKRAIAINVPGSNSRDFWVKLGINNNKINLLHSTIDTEDGFFPLPKPKKYDFIYLGTMEKRKQIGLIIKALAILKKDLGNDDLKLCIIGKGEDEDELLKLTLNYHLKDNIIFAGYQTNIIEWLNESKIFVMASRNEGIPCAMMEAMACELLPIVPDVADIEDVVKNGVTGVLLKETTPETLYTAMRNVYLNYDKMYEMRKKSRQIIEDNHSYHSAVNKWNNILKNIKNNEGTN